MEDFHELVEVSELLAFESSASESSVFELLAFEFLVHQLEDELEAELADIVVSEALAPVLLVYHVHHREMVVRERKQVVVLEHRLEAVQERRQGVVVAQRQEVVQAL